MTNRREMLALGALGGMAFAVAAAPPSIAAGCDPAAVSTEAIGSAILDKYVAAINAHDTSSFPQIFTESYIQQDRKSVV